MTLHIIRTDILLHVLGGFSPSPNYVLTQRSYPPALIKQLFILSKKKRIKYGELSRLAERWGQKRANLAVYIWRMRRRKELVPSYWWDVIAAKETDCGAKAVPSERQKKVDNDVACGKMV